MTCYTTLTSPGDVRRNFHKADYPKLCAQIGAVDWAQLEGLDIEEGYQLLRESLANAVSECIPLARSSRSRKNIYMTSQALRLKKQKLLLWRRYTRSQDPLDLARFKTCRNKLRGLTRRLRQQFETQLVNDIKVNPKAFWRYTNTRLKTKTSIGDIRSSTGTLESHDGAKANILNTYFGSVFTREEPFVAAPYGSVFTREEPSVVAPLGTSIITGEESSVVAPPGSVFTREEPSVVASLGTSVFAGEESSVVAPPGSVLTREEPSVVAPSTPASSPGRSPL